MRPERIAFIGGGNMAEAILGLADDAAQRADLVAKGREQARRFTWAASAKRHIEVYREAADL